MNGKNDSWDGDSSLDDLRRAVSKRMRKLDSFVQRDQNIIVKKKEREKKQRVIFILDRKSTLVLTFASSTKRKKLPQSFGKLSIYQRPLRSQNDPISSFPPETLCVSFCVQITISRIIFPFIHRSRGDPLKRMKTNKIMFHRLLALQEREK